MAKLFTSFDRQIYMTGGVRKRLLNTINEAELAQADLSLVNSLFGLLDGYLYPDMLDKLAGLPVLLRNRIKALYNLACKYPTVEYTTFQVNLSSDKSADLLARLLNETDSLIALGASSELIADLEAGKIQEGKISQLLDAVLTYDQDNNKVISVIDPNSYHHIQAFTLFLRLEFIQGK